jgi:hypothetical protein
VVAHVRYKTAARGQLYLADGTRVAPVERVFPGVSAESTGLPEALVTSAALEGLLLRVALHVLLHGGCPREGLIAHVAVVVVAAVRPQVHDQTPPLLETLEALVALERLLDGRVREQRLGQRATHIARFATARRFLLHPNTSNDLTGR